MLSRIVRHYVIDARNLRGIGQKLLVLSELRTWSGGIVRRSLAGGTLVRLGAFLLGRQCYIRSGLICTLCGSGRLSIALGKPFMTFAQRLQSAAAQVDARLSSLLGDDETKSRDGIEAWPDRLKSAMRHAAIGGGKRVRPFLVFESAALFGVDASRAVDAAAAIECVHCYSLVHDDLPCMDNDELRRGQPTVWKAYDEWTAILAGDALLTLAFDILSRPQTHPDPSVRVELIATLARASGAGGMAGGQALDLQAGKLEPDRRSTIEEITRLQSMKTGALITCACEMGAILGGADKPARAALRRYGTAIGSAFQIADDLLDAEGEESATGKAVAKDAAAGKATLIGHIGVEAARARLSELEAGAIAALSDFEGRASTLTEAARFVANRRM